MTDTQDDDILEGEVYQNTEVLVTPKVPETQKNLRLDKFLVSCYPQFSRNQMIRLIKEGAVSVEDCPSRTLAPDDEVKVGEHFKIIPPEATPADPVLENIPLDILYEDKDLLVVNKPAGLVVHPGAGNTHGTLVNALLAHCGDSLSGIGGVRRPGIVHRIDKDTSGILVVAKNDWAHRHLAEQFAEHTIERVYQAFVWGFVKNTTGVISGYIGRSPTNRQKMAVVKTNGKHATTHYERLEVFGGGLASHIQCTLETGRTHQIRVHMASVGHSLIGDTVYGIVPYHAPEALKFFPRQALHAGFLGFIHPTTEERMTFEVPLPEDMQTLLNNLRSLSCVDQTDHFTHQG